MVDAPQNGVRIEDSGRNPMGVTRVANEVVAWIAALSALQVEGVHAMYQPSGQSIDRILRRPVAHRGAKVEIDAEGRLSIDLWVVMTAGHSVPRVGAECQRRVADAIERMLGMQVASIDVFVSEVVFA